MTGPEEPKIPSEILRRSLDLHALEEHDRVVAALKAAGIEFPPDDSPGWERIVADELPGMLRVATDDRINVSFYRSEQGSMIRAGCRAGYVADIQVTADEVRGKIVSSYLQETRLGQAETESDDADS